MIEVENGDYVAAIMHALGDGGASLRITVSAGRTSVEITGQPTGPTKSVLSGPARHQDTVTLSSEAQARISDATVALTIISSASAQTRGSAKGRSVAGATPAGDDAAIISSQQGASTNSDTPIVHSATSAPFANIADIVAAAQAAFSDPNAIYGSTASQLDLMTFSMGADEKSSFLAAVRNRTLNVQNTADIPGIEAPETAVITGTGMALLGGVYSSVAAEAASGQAVSAAMAKAGGYGLMSFDAFGGSQLITWGPPSTAAA